MNETVDGTPFMVILEMDPLTMQCKLLFVQLELCTFSSLISRRSFVVISKMSKWEIQNQQDLNSTLLFYLFHAEQLKGVVFSRAIHILMTITW